MRELTEDVKKQNSEREELGVNLYEVQQELGRQQANLEEQHEVLARSSQNRKKMEAELENERDEFNSKMNQIKLVKIQNFLKLNRTLYNKRFLVLESSEIKNCKLKMNSQRVVYSQCNIQRKMFVVIFR